MEDFVDSLREDEVELARLLAKPTCFIVVGKPGVGKSTLAQKLSEIWGCILIDDTDLLNTHIKNETAEGKRLLEQLNEGKAIPHSEVMELIYARLGSADVEHYGYVLSCLPFKSEGCQMIHEQTEKLKSLNLSPDVIINIKCDDVDLVRRLSGLKQHPEGERLYTRERWNYEDVYSKKEEDEDEDSEAVDDLDEENKLPRDFTDQMVWIPENSVQNAGDRMNEFKDNMLRPLQKYMADHHPLYLLELDGHNAPEELVKSITSHLGCLAIQPVSVPVTLHTEDDDPLEGLEAEDLFGALSTRMALPGFKRRRSRWGQTCPVALKEGKVVTGTPEFSVGFQDKIYIMSSQEAYEKFFINPRQYLLPLRPRVPCKVSIVGPSLSGKTTVSKLLTQHINSVVLDAEWLMHVALKEKLETVQRETTVDAIGIVNVKLGLDGDDSVDSNHPEVQAIVLDAIEDTKQLHLASFDLYVEALEKRMEKIEGMDTGGGNIMGWVLDNFPKTTPQMLALQKAGLMPNIMICLLGSDGHNTNLRRMYEANREAIEEAVEKRLKEEAQNNSLLLPEMEQLEPKSNLDTVEEDADDIDAPPRRHYKLGYPDGPEMDEYKLHLEKFVGEWMEMAELLKVPSRILNIVNKSPDDLVQEIIQELEQPFQYLASEVSQVELEDEEDLDALAELEGEEELSTSADLMDADAEDAGTRRLFGETYHFCPVALKNNNILWPGTDEIAAKYRERTYYFSSQEARESFIENPRLFVAQTTPLKAPALRIFLLGVRGSGKTTHGKELAHQLGLFHIQFREQLQMLIVSKTKKHVPHADELVSLEDNADELDDILAEARMDAEEAAREEMKQTEEEGAETEEEGEKETEGEGEKTEGEGEKKTEEEGEKKTEEGEKTEGEGEKKTEEGEKKTEEEGEKKTEADGEKKTEEDGEKTEEEGEKKTEEEGEKTEKEGEKKTEEDGEKKTEEEGEKKTEEEGEREEDKLSTDESEEEPLTQEELFIKNYLTGEESLDPRVLELVIAPFWKEEPYRSTGFILEGFPYDGTQVQCMLEEMLFPDAVVVMEVEVGDVQERLLPKYLENWHERRRVRQAKIDEILFLRKKKRDEAIIRRRAELIAEQELRERTRHEEELQSETADEDDEPEESSEDDIEATLEEEFPPDEDEDLDNGDTEEDAIERLEMEIEERFETDTNNLDTILELLTIQNIPILTINGSCKQQISQQRLLKQIQPLLTNRESLFQKCQPIAASRAQKLLLSSYKFHSAFGCHDPVKQYKEKDMIQPLLWPLTATHPLIFHQFIYFFASVENRNTFMVNPFKYLRQKKPTTSFPMKIAITGPRKSGKTSVAKRFSQKYGLAHLSIGGVMREVLTTWRHTNLAEQMNKHLMEGLVVPDDLAVQCLDRVLMKSVCTSRGYVLDGFPMTLKQAELMESLSIVPITLVELDVDAEEIEKRRSADKMKPNKPYPVLDSADVFQSCNSVYNNEVAAVRKHFQELHQNYVLLDGLKSKWWIWDHIAKDVTISMRYVDTYLEKTHTGQAACIYRMCITPQEFECRLGQFGQFCPVCLGLHEQLVDCSETVALTYAAVYQSSYYKMCCQSHLEIFLSNADQYVAPDSPYTLPPADLLPRRLTDAPDGLPEQAELKGFCPVTYLSGKQRYEALVQGKLEHAVDYRGQLHIFETEQKQKMFLRSPETYGGLMLPKKVPPVEEPLALTGLPIQGYLEQSVAVPLIKAMTAVGCLKPKYPFLSVERSALFYIALYLKAFNHKSTDYARKRYKKKMALFEEDCELIPYLSSVMREKFRPPGELPVDFHIKLNKFLTLGEPPGAAGLL